MPIVEQRGANIVILRKEIHNRFLLSPSDDTFLFSSLLEHAPFIVWVSDERGRLRYVNQTWLGFTGRPIEMELGDGWIRMSILKMSRNALSVSDWQQARAYHLMTNIESVERMANIAGSATWPSHNIGGKPNNEG